MGERVGCLFRETSPRRLRFALLSVEEDIQLATAALGQALPWLGISAPAQFEAAGWAFGGPVKLQLAFADPSWRSWPLCNLPLDFGSS